MTEVRRAGRWFDKIRVWWEGHQGWAFLIVFLLCAASAVFAFDESKGQGSRATTAANKAVSGETTARQAQAAILIQTQHQIAVVAHSALLNACIRGQAGRIANHDNALHSRSTARAFAKYLDGVISRQIQAASDSKLPPDSRARARSALTDARAQLMALNVNPSIPPLPPKCAKVIPTVSDFETIAKHASKGSTK